ncbi:hypothetical protein [Thalassobacillus pellis]|uniref:hypothetical protein n=1 Tax=Thalassobacillus pellis TaxID=748008 RepID=UPI00195F4188|nr:hypothetical protein [Thalassobacillus pellis]MBM7551130.1 hypothetical protein [Thalassobacillus pellis]
MVFQETVVVEGSIKGMKFSKPVLISYDPDSQTPEEALINFFGSQAQSFEELAIQRGWEESYWTYPPYYGMVV